MIKLLLIRHALTDSVGVRFSGRTPGVSLNDEGRKQAQMLAERLADLPVSAIYSSPLERAIETAVPLIKIFDLSCIVSPDFIEIDFGEWTNLTIDDVRNDFEFRNFNKFRSSTRIPGGELIAEVQARVVTGIQKLKERHPGKTVAVISHADIIRTALAYYAGIHPDMMNRIEISTASVSILELYDETARITRINDTGLF
jgi:probable phosphoglycerate mutase